jgi:hypothetical protein
MNTRMRKRCPILEVIEDSYILPETGEPIQLLPYQRRILNHCFTEVTQGRGRPRRLPYRTVIISMPKKGGKTELASAITYAWTRVYGGEIYSCANDETQSKRRMYERLHEFLAWLYVHDNDRYLDEVVDRTQDRIAFNGPEGVPSSTIRALAIDPEGEAGARNSLVVFDELWGYSTGKAERFWSELQPIPTIPHSMRLVTTYAGFYGESELLYSLYEQCVRPHPDTGEPQGERIKELKDLPCYQYGSMFCYWDHEPRAPWLTPEFLLAAKNDPANKLRPSEYLRLWENRWTTGTEAFIDMDVFDRIAREGDEEGLYNHLEREVPWFG